MDKKRRKDEQEVLVGKNVSEGGMRRESGNLYI